MTATILIVDDDPHICDVIAYALEQEGMNVTTAENGAEGLARVTTMPISLVILDVGMPVMDGLEMCREIRKSSDVPILFLSARDDEIDRIVGLEIGGDDYVTKPFSPRELRARIKAVLRRTEPVSPEIWRFGDVEVDLSRGELRRDGRPVEVTALELKLLSAFLASRGRVLSRQQLLETAWGSDTFVTDRAVDAHIVNLRRKIEDHPTEPRYIVSVRGLGYRFDG